MQKESKSYDFHLHLTENIFFFLVYLEVSGSGIALNEQSRTFNFLCYYLTY